MDTTIPHANAGTPLDPEYIQKKIDLIEKGLPIDISEEELTALEATLRGARSFYLDILQAIEKRKEAGEDVEKEFIAESKNMANVGLALRSIDDFRKTHWAHIKNA